jgi:hypothetical protein
MLSAVSVAFLESLSRTNASAYRLRATLPPKVNFTAWPLPASMVVRTVGGLTLTATTSRGESSRLLLLPSKRGFDDRRRDNAAVATFLPPPEACDSASNVLDDRA